nr:unnamed protein product [Callosobruchus analis]
MSLHLHGTVLRTGRVPKWRHVHEQRGRIFVHLRERLDRAGLLREHRRLRRRGLFQRCHLHRPSWEFLLSVYAGKDGSTVSSG